MTAAGRGRKRASTAAQTQASNEITSGTQCSHADEKQNIACTPHASNQSKVFACNINASTHEPIYTKNNNSPECEENPHSTTASLSSLTECAGGSILASPPKRARALSPAQPSVGDDKSVRHELPDPAEPWDLLRDPSKYDAIQNADRLNEQCLNSAIEAHAPNCGTFSRARERPIPGVFNSPKPLRSLAKPRGLEYIFRMPASTPSRVRVERDTYMADMSALSSKRAHLEGRGFSLEHPGRSIAHELHSWKDLCAQKGVKKIFHHHCMFEGCTHRKYQCEITNIEELAIEVDRICESDAICTRTGLPHSSWKHEVSDGKLIKPSTAQLAEYPSGYCQAKARAYVAYLSRVGCSRSFSFIEVFSGANAVLTAAVFEEIQRHNAARTLCARALPVPVPQECQALMDHSTASSSSVKPKAPFVGKLPSSYQLADQAAGRQPRWNPHYQLIKDGINDPDEHMALARKLEHPCLYEGVLPEDLRANLRAVTEEGPGLILRRIRVVETLEAQARTLEPQRLQDCANAGYCFKMMESKMNVALMEFAGKMAQVEDNSIPRKCLAGLPIVGPADKSAFFLPYAGTQLVTVKELLRSAPERRDRIIRKVRTDAKFNDAALLQAVYDKTAKEVQLKQMSPPMTLEEVIAKHGNLFNVAQRYGIEQGFDSKGNKKYRCIDNHADNMNNAAAERTQTVPMTSVSSILLLIRSLSRALGTKIDDPEWQPVGSTEDLKAAYRQVPLSEANVCVAITAVWNPFKANVEFHEMWGQPFGAGHAVPNFYRLAEWASRVTRRLLCLVLDHFFDDYWIVEPKCIAASGVWAFRRLMAAFGLKLDPEKAQLPCSVWHALGVYFDMQAIRSNRLIFARAKPQRIANGITEIASVFNRGRLKNTHAARIFGKFDFINTTLFGKVGRTGMLALKKRQYEDASGIDWRLDDKLAVCLLWMANIVTAAPPRELRIDNDPCDNILLYTDGSSDPSRSPMHVVGAVLIDPRTKVIRYTFTPVPDAVVQSWLPAKQQIHLVELFAGPVAMDTWASQLSGRNIFHFVDNSAALGCIVKGYSGTEDLVRISCDYWLRAAARRMCIYADRVESDSNLSDDPSRLNKNKVMEKIGAIFDEPCLDYLSEQAPSRDPRQWFGGSDHLQQLLARLKIATSPLWVKASAGNALELQKPTHHNPNATRGQ